MNNFIISFVAILYFIVGCRYMLNQQLGFGIAWLAYSVANIGLLLAAKGV